MPVRDIYDRDKVTTYIDGGRDETRDDGRSLGDSLLAVMAVTAVTAVMMEKTDRQSATKRYETDSQLSSGQCFVAGLDGVVASPDWPNKRPARDSSRGRGGERERERGRERAYFGFYLDICELARSSSGIRSKQGKCLSTVSETDEEGWPSYKPMT
ncbi:hypothetical protein TESG_06358 [Trichophyton tonsurans CBS 112818]|uniref:Uncharacterized protein n=2 Tax=Trichophyton TaxID=5550 RepID=F2PZA0_TRIEC|nr:hypothetical protein TESG_06358 [Trichophyton tonsurans CBS 112818]EGE07218.1 hypothetical protein TEQG_06291 [Trichophyton equinum CBS 127.97]